MAIFEADGGVGGGGTVTIGLIVAVGIFWGNGLAAIDGKVANAAAVGRLGIDVSSAVEFSAGSEKVNKVPPLRR